MGYIIAFILGIFVATVGVQGVVNVAQTGVHKVQDVSRAVAKEQQ
jgi:hypothetical protein